MKNNFSNPFKTWEIYVGMLLGFVIFLQFEINRNFLYGELVESDCIFKIIGCSEMIILELIIILAAGFLLGWKINRWRFS